MSPTLRLFRRAWAAIACATLAVVAPVVAEDEVTTDEEVVVSGERPAASVTPAPATELQGEELRMKVEGTLGATLDDELGVHNATFGPGVGMPVIRGLTGARVKVIQDGLGTHDGASVSPDHAVTVDTAMAERITVRRGPGTLRYGSGAMGGVVEIDEGRIAKQPLRRMLSGQIESRAGVDPDRHVQSFKLKSGLGPFSAQLGGSIRESALVPIPGVSLNEAAVREQFGDTVQFENTRGVLLNSDAESRSGQGGFSLSGEHGYVGAAWSYLDNEYGIPPGGLPPHSDVPGVPPQPQRIRIDMFQRRYEVESALYLPWGLIDQVTIEGGLVQYQHDETEREFVSTTFVNEAREARAEIAHSPTDNAPGEIGVHWVDRDFSATGIETFVPASTIQTLGVYFNQALDFDPLRIEVAARRERVLTRPDELTRTIGGFFTVDLPAKLEYKARSLAAAVELALTPTLTARVDWSRAARAPDVQELLSLGPHLSTRSFDIGNVELEVEQARTLDVGLLWDARYARLRLNAFKRKIDDFIYQENLGFLYDIEEQLFRLECARIDQCVPAFGYLQRDARFAGFEAEIAVPWELPFGLFELSLFGDSVRGYFDEDGTGDVPRLPPRTVGVAARLEGERWMLGSRYTSASAQRRAGRRESPTAGYAALGADFSYRLPLGDDRDATLFVRGRNLLNEEIRNSTSFLRDFMPEGGRNVELGLRLTF